MNKTTPTDRYEKLLEESAEPEYELQLFIMGASRRSTVALENLKKICERHLQGRYRLQVVDLLQQPKMARAEQIVATPTLIKVLPEPVRKFVGDMSRLEGVLFGALVRSEETEPSEEGNE